MEWTTARPWERQKGESEKAFAAFAAYRDMGDERSMTALAKQISKSRALLYRWKERWNWDERVLAYDNDLQQSIHAEAIRSYQEMLRRHIGISVQLQNKAIQSLRSMDPKKMRPKDLIVFLQTAVKIEREARARIVSDSVPQGDGANDFEPVYLDELPEISDEE